MDFRAVFDDPIVAGDSAIQVAMFNITADFLGADEPDFEFIVIHVGHVGAAAD